MAAHNTLFQDLAVNELNGHGALRTIAMGTLVAGTLDISVAIITWLLRGVSATRVLQGVAGGLLGRATFDGGAATAMLGLLLHFAIMSVIVTVFYVASRGVPLLTRQWFWCGLAYGIAVYLVMTFIVVPLSAFPGRMPSPSAIVQGLIVHMLCVGLSIAFITRRFATA
jgi:hypothetical protein